MGDPGTLEGFLARWRRAAGAERANYQLFFSELCDVLDLPRPDPAGDDTALNAYVFERAVTFHDPGGETRPGRIDVYRRGSFILEAKQYRDPVPQAELKLTAALAPRKGGPVRGTVRWDDAMLRARAQAERYARALPADEDPPPFLLVVDVGHTFELFADFTQKGKAYLPFPDPTSHRFRLDDLARPEIRERLRSIWLDPASLNPALHAAAVTREVSAHLAELAKSFEGEGHDPKGVADFLARSLFCMFAEDVGLLPKDSFSRLLDEIRGDAGAFVPLVTALFREMNDGAYSTVLRQKLLRFNGGLFEDCSVPRVTPAQLGLLRSAAKLDWRNVEPSIFGTLLERALDPRERHKLGAHYTPRAYVERLVLPTVIEPLREDWAAARAAAVTHARAGRMKEAVAEVRAFHGRLCAVRVLDPACGSGNFLYVTLELMKRLEGEVLDQLAGFGDSQALLDLATVTVDPHQFLGLELNPRAAAVADLVLWIGHLQWHFRTRGRTLPAEPVLRKFENIRCRDAVLDYDAEARVTWLDAARDPGLPGLPDTVRAELKRAADDVAAHPAKYERRLVEMWDRRSTKPDSATGRDVPDESRTTLLRRYTNPRPAEWPDADFIVGNPPFIGKGRLREDLGDGYAETLRAAYPDVPDSADFVMYWWYKAAELALQGRCRRFGFITTNSIRQTFNRRIVQKAMDRGIYLTFAIPDHPWVDTADGAAVRIAMTVGARAPDKDDDNTKPAAPRLASVVKETPQKKTGESAVQLSLDLGVITADLTSGAGVSRVGPLKANDGISCPGIKLHGAGFILTPDQAQGLGLGSDSSVSSVIHPYRNGRDLTDWPRGAYVIDLFGLTEEDVRARYPAVYQHVLTHVRPERVAKGSSKDGAGYAQSWWLFGKTRREMRESLRGLQRFVATVETAKHRVFQFLDARIRPDNRLIVIAVADAFHLGVLSSRIHVVYALAAGGTLEDRPVYNKTRCFDPFPFPAADAAAKERVRGLAEALDAHRKRAQEAHGIGLTAMYNVLEKLRAGGALTARERELHDRALVSTLRQLHDDLDAAVAAAYGWPWPMEDAEILERVVALNAERAAEEARGVIRWLRPDYQNPPVAAKATQGRLDLADPREGPRPRGPIGGPVSSDPPSSRVLRPAAGLVAPERSEGGAGGPPGTRRKAGRTAKRARQPWPKTLPEQVRAVEAALASGGPRDAKALAALFLRARAAGVQEILDTLATLGRI
jgi:hypothetical protein